MRIANLAGKPRLKLAIKVTDIESLFNIYSSASLRFFCPCIDLTLMAFFKKAGADTETSLKAPAKVTGIRVTCGKASTGDIVAIAQHFSGLFKTQLIQKFAGSTN